MEAIKVQLREPTKQGRLYYQAGPQIREDIILMKSEVSEKWSYFVNISSEVLLDFDANRTLRVVEAVSPRDSWLIQPGLKFPTATQVADVKLLEPLEPRVIIDLPVVVYSDETKSCTLILFEQVNTTVMWVELSSRCLAAIEDGELKGFSVALQE